MQVPNRLKRLAKREGNESRPYVCLGCGSRFEHQYHVCPECGGYSVERAQWQRDDPIR